MSKLNLGVVYSVAKKNKKTAKNEGEAKADKFAEGGEVYKPSEQALIDKTVPSAQSLIDKTASPKPKVQKLAEGGVVQGHGFKVRTPKMIEDDMATDGKPKKYDGMSEDKGPSEEEYDANKFAKGGMVDMGPAEEDGQVEPEGLESDNDMMSDEHEEELEKHASIAAAIMSKRSMMAEGGMVDLDDSATEHSDLADQQDAALKENYDEDISQPLDSNEHGDDIEADAHDMISRIRAKLRAKRS